MNGEKRKILMKITTSSIFTNIFALWSNNSMISVSLPDPNSLLQYNFLLCSFCHVGLQHTTSQCRSQYLFSNDEMFFTLSRAAQHILMIYNVLYEYMVICE